MVGELAVSFCERRAGQACVCVDLWSYPDGTYNLVVEHSGVDAKQEYSFPCSFQQLAGILDRKPLTSSNEFGSVLVERCGDSVCAQFETEGEDAGFRYCISVEAYKKGIEALEANDVGYLA